MHATCPALRMKSRRMRWVGHITCMRRIINSYDIFVETLNGRDQLEDLVIDGRLVLKFILNYVKMWTWFTLLRIVSSVGLF
jgi:hypothetical protein